MKISRLYLQKCSKDRANIDKKKVFILENECNRWRNFNPSIFTVLCWMCQGGYTKE